jgi:hypothetical protein
MTLKEFLTLYDCEGSIVLLEGKRNVLDHDKPRLERLGEILAKNSKHILFRSGNADGADLFFASGVIKVDYTRLQVITPYKGHRSSANKAYDTISLENINLPNETDVIYHSKSNKKTHGLIDKYVAGNRDKYAIKAAYIIRDTVKVIGAENVRPATFGIFYDDLTDPLAGGTGHTMRVCMQNNIPLIDQKTWFSWL